MNENSQTHSYILIERQEIFQGRVISLRTDTLQKEEKTLKWDVVVHPGAVAVIPVTEKGELIFVKQWRHPVGKEMIELPAGTLKAGESALDCAQRELREETGFRAKEIAALGGFYSTPGFCNEYISLFLAKNLVRDPLPREAYEEIDLLFLSLSKVKTMIESGEICDAKTIAGVYRYASK